MTVWSREEIHYVAERAYRLYRQGRLTDAAILFEGIAAIDPHNAYCRKALAAISIGLGQHRVAVRHLSSIIARDGRDLDALARRCEAFIAAGDFAAARQDLDSLAALPDGAEAVRRLEARLAAVAAFVPALVKDSQLLPRPAR
jgi:thioredoxin-like negative regulator of GroEL